MKYGETTKDRERKSAREREREREGERDREIEGERDTKDKMVNKSARIVKSRIHDYMLYKRQIH